MSLTRIPSSPCRISRTSSPPLRCHPPCPRLQLTLLLPLPRSRYADHIGIHYVLCSKLRQFPYEDIEFFLPQLCHLIISVDNESMALEEFLLDLCEESVTAALLVRRPGALSRS